MGLIRSKILTAMLSVLSVWVLFSLVSVELERNEAKEDETAIEARISEVKESNKQLEKYLKNFENRNFLEREARLRLNYKSNDEEVVFVHRDLNSQKASSSEEADSEGHPFYLKWWQLIKNF